MLSTELGWLQGHGRGGQGEPAVEQGGGPPPPAQLGCPPWPAHCGLPWTGPSHAGPPPETGHLCVNLNKAPLRAGSALMGVRLSQQTASLYAENSSLPLGRPAPRQQTTQTNRVALYRQALEGLVSPSPHVDAV